MLGYLTKGNETFPLLKPYAMDVVHAGKLAKKGKSLMPLEPATSRIDSYQAKNCQYRVVGFPGGRCLLGAEAFGPMKCAACSEMACSGVQLNRSAMDAASGQWTVDSS